jgi:uncharacterized protein (UPF0332 family)
MEKKQSWLCKCFRIKGGIKVIDSNGNSCRIYLKWAKKTIMGIKDLIEKDDFLWASSRVYYSVYYSLYAFLQKIGIKSENHSCSIALVYYLLEDRKLVDFINSLKSERISSQYFMEFPSKNELEGNYKKAKKIYLKFYNLCQINENEIKNYRKKVSKLIDEISNEDKK